MSNHLWLPSTCADPRFPMRVVRGVLASGRSAIAYLPDNRILYNGWGHTGNVEVIGQDLKELPDTLAVIWFSYTEDCFYFVEAPLETDHFDELFRQGVHDPNLDRTTKFRYILVGMLLNGAVSVWVVGPGAVVEVTTLQGTKHEAQWESIFAGKKYSREEFIATGLERRQVKPALDDYQTLDDKPLELQKKYHTRYPWKLKLVGGEGISLWARTFDGQSLPVNIQTGLPIIENQTVLKQLQLSWRASTTGLACHSTLTLNEVEIFQVLQQLAALAPEATVQFNIQLGQRSGEVSLSVQNDRYLVPLNRFKNSP